MSLKLHVVTGESYPDEEACGVREVVTMMLRDFPGKVLVCAGCGRKRFVPPNEYPDPFERSSPLNGFAVIHGSCCVVEPP